MTVIFSLPVQNLNLRVEDNVFYTYLPMILTMSMWGNFLQSMYSVRIHKTHEACTLARKSGSRVCTDTYTHEEMSYGSYVSRSFWSTDTDKHQTPELAWLLGHRFQQNTNAHRSFLQPRPSAVIV